MSTGHHFSDIGFDLSSFHSCSLLAGSPSWRRVAMPSLAVAVAVACSARVCPRALAADEFSLPRPTRPQAEWHDCEVGMFVHFAPNTWLDQECDDLSKSLGQIDPEKLDADQWVRVAESMGAKYLVFVAKHVGGFCWWTSLRLRITRSAAQPIIRKFAAYGMR